MEYLAVKAVHIVAATVVFGTGLGSAFNLWRAQRSGRTEAIAVVSRNVVLADWIFTAPSVVILPATGVWMILIGGWPIESPWIVLSIGLYLLAGSCWLPVVWLQIRMARLARTSLERGTPLPPAFRQSFRVWFWLGWPAFIAVIVIIHLMTVKPELRFI